MSDDQINDQPEEVKEPVAEAKYTEKHTPENTPMKKLVPAKIEGRAGTTAEKETGFLTIFLGNTKKIDQWGNELVSKWLQYQSVKSLWEEGEVDESTFLTAKSTWGEFIEKNFPDQSSEDVSSLAQRLYNFKEELLDNVTLRSKLINEPDISNQSDRGSKHVTADIIGKRPGENTKGFSISEVMHRTVVREEDDEYQFDLLLRNSYTALTFNRPDPLARANLINDINRTVKGYVRQVGHNSLQLAQVAGMKVIWEFLQKRIIRCSVTGIVDFRDLARIIRVTDFQTICVGLLRATSSNGVNMNLQCLFDACDWSEFQVVDPDQLHHTRRSIETPEQSAIFGNLINNQTTYTVEETLALIRGDLYGLETNRVYNDQETLYFTIAPPSLAEAFETFDYYVGRVNPDLQDIRSKTLDPKDYENQVGIYLATLGATEYLHWVSSFTRVAKPDSGGEDLVIHRADSDPKEFNKGLMDSLLASAPLNKNLTKFILNKTPYMTRTFTGLANSRCPKCGKHPDEHEGIIKDLGYTPLNAFMAFFTHTQLTIMTEAVKTATATQEATSD